MKQCFIISFLFCQLASSGFCQDTNPFLVGSELKNAVTPGFTETPKPIGNPVATITVNGGKVVAPVSNYIYGNNANPYMTQIITEPTLINYIKDLSPNIIRFPGGNLSSVFFWDAEKNQPPADAPPKLVDANGAEKDPNYWYGKNNESWTLSVDNYYAMLHETGNTGMITVNYGYARYSTDTDPVASAAHHAAEWVRYDNGRTKFWEIGNESNGTWQEGYRIKLSNNKDGQPEIVTGELYGKHFKVFADSMRKAAQEKGHEIYIGAQLLAEAPATWWTNTDKTWNSGVFQEAGNLPDYFIIHSYYTPYNTNSNAAAILNSATTVTDEMMHFVTNAISTAGLQQKPIALTEWNIFAVGSKQQISFVNGMHAAITLGELIKNKYGMAARWNFANGYDNGDDHGTFSQGEPNIPRWNPRPSFHYMYFFQKYFGNTMIESNVQGGNNNILAYASTFSSNEAGVVLVNKGTSAAVIKVEMLNHGVGDRYYWYTLTGGTDNGEFSLKVNVNGTAPALSAGGPPSYKTVPARSALTEGGIVISAPPRSVIYLLVDHGNNIITNVEPEQNKGLYVYPNPSPANIRINLPSAGFNRMEIMDSRGKSVMTENIDHHKENVFLPTSLPEGVYILRAVRGVEVFIGKFIIGK